MFKVSKFPKPTFYIYGLVCPVYEEIKYIGLSKNPQLRLRQHITGVADNKRKREWIDKLKELGLEPTIVILNSYEDRLVALEEEIRYIEENKSTVLNGFHTVKYPSVAGRYSYEAMNNINMTMSKEGLRKLNEIVNITARSRDREIEFLISHKYELLKQKKKRK